MYVCPYAQTYSLYKKELRGFGSCFLSFSFSLFRTVSQAVRVGIKNKINFSFYRKYQFGTL